MKSDGKTCLPQNDLTEITCSASGMRLELHQCVLPGVAEPTLLDTDCAADLVGDTFVLETSLDGCDTAFVVDNDVVTFSVSEKFIQGKNCSKNILRTLLIINRGWGSFSFSCSISL